jgi:hypothetical protein
MASNYSVFKPRYSITVRLLLTGMPVLFFGFLVIEASIPRLIPSPFWYLTLLLGIVTSLAPFFFIREIRFTEVMVIRRHFLPDIFIKHKEIEKVEGDKIYVDRRRIRIGKLENIRDLKQMLQSWSAARTLKESTGSNPQVRSPYPARGYGGYASFWGILFGVIIMIIGQNWIHVDPRWLLGITFVLVYYSYIYIVPKYL